MRKAIIVSVVLFAIPALVLATNEGNGNGNGGPENDGGSTQGPAGPQGLPGTNGTNGANGSNGQNGKDGLNGKNGAVGAQGPQGPGRVDPRMNEARLGIDTAIRLYDGKHVQLQAYNVWSPSLHTSEDALSDGRNLQFGMRFVFKLGSSYEERQNNALRAQLEALQAIVAKLQ